MTGWSHFLLCGCCKKVEKPWSESGQSGHWLKKKSTVKQSQHVRLVHEHSFYFYFLAWFCVNSLFQTVTSSTELSGAICWWSVVNRHSNQCRWSVNQCTREQLTAAESAVCCRSVFLSFDFIDLTYCYVALYRTGFCVCLALMKSWCVWRWPSCSSPSIYFCPDRSSPFYLLFRETTWKLQNIVHSRFQYGSCCVHRPDWRRATAPEAQRSLSSKQVGGSSQPPWRLKHTTITTLKK